MPEVYVSPASQALLQQSRLKQELRDRALERQDQALTENYRQYMKAVGDKHNWLRTLRTLEATAEERANQHTGQMSRVPLKRLIETVDKGIQKSTPGYNPFLPSALQQFFSGPGFAQPLIDPQTALMYQQMFGLPNP